MQGGKYIHGFAAGLLSSLGGSYTSQSWSMGAKLFVGAALGGTASVLAGGKFANGAITGAFVVLFNHLAHQIQDGIKTPKNTEGGMISSKEKFEKFMYHKAAFGELDPATGLLIEVSSFKIVKDGDAKYLILPWDANTSTESISDLSTVPEGWTAVEQYHTHPLNSPPGRADRNYSFTNGGIPVYTMGANGNQYRYSSYKYSNGYLVQRNNTPVIFNWGLETIRP